MSNGFKTTTRGISVSLGYQTADKTSHGNSKSSVYNSCLG